MTKPVIFFSLPRSGSTLFCGLLAQNNDFKVIEASLTVALLNSVRELFFTHTKALAVPQQDRCLPVLKNMIQGYYGHDTSIVFDKNREWLFYLDVADQLFEDYKIVVLVRDPLECAASFLRLREKEPITWTGFDSDAVREDVFPTSLRFARNLLSPTGTIGRSYTSLYEAALVQKRSSQMLFVDYTKLCKNPKRQLDRVCDFIGTDRYYPQLNNIKNANKQLDRHYGMFDTLHTIEPKIREAREDLGRLEPFKEEFRGSFPLFWHEWI